ncbi:MAG TPA: hypothetical protein VN436_08235, partial [Holophaga sp.]|nr:hypothetical protein [Holophaga sp.]
MRGLYLTAAVACTLAGIGCRSAQSYKPSQALAPGTLLIHFTTKIEGPVDLLIDDVRIPVARTKKKSTTLTVMGLSTGVHRYFISSPQNAFGPDHGQIELPADQGIYLVNFAQHLNAVLYG